jgi:hypothetical protein
MGGRALKSTYTRRYEKEEYLKLTSEILKKIRRFFYRAEIPRYYHTKESFGDMDILVSMKDYNGDIREFIITQFKPNEIFHNGNCWSFDYKEFQIDFITTSEEHFDSYLTYLSFNDLGNYVGRLAHHMGGRYGSEGFWVTYYYKDTKHKIMVSKDQEKIYEFLGLDFNRWLKGFDTLEEIFQFISESPYFNWSKFQLEELNRINRERNLKRVSYMSFLDWIDNNVSDDEHKYEHNLSDTELYKRIDNFFPEANLFDEITRIEYEVSKSKYAAILFNGRHVIDKFGLEGKELGQAMSGFKEYIHDQFGDFNETTIKFGTENMLEEFDYYYNGKRVVN